MTDEQLEQSLETVIARTGHERFRALCLTDGTVSAWDQAGYQAVVYLLAAEVKGAIVVPDALKLATPAARKHGLTGPPRCGCRGGSCARPVEGGGS